MSVIYAFNHTPVPSVSEVGGKGYSLIRMASAGFNVPGGFVCAAQFFDDWTQELEAGPAWARLQEDLSHGALSETSVEALKDQIDGLSFSPVQSKAIETAMAEMSLGGVCAVRSSSPEEDLEGSSFAGMYETLLGVPTEGLADAIRTVFKSAFDERVFSYKQAKGFDTTTVRIAVIVMEQVPSDTAGVGFSVNPINNDYDEAVLNANYGLGESVVSGSVTPDFFVMDKVGGTVVSKTLGNKAQSVVLDEAGGVAERSSGDADTFCITDAQAQEITQMIVDVEKLYGVPMDIEWAYSNGQLYMLQARPITTYTPLPSKMLTEPGAPRRLYFDFGLVDMMTINQPMSPLTIDWMFGSLGMWVSPFVGPMAMDANADPANSFVFGAGARTYLNLSQAMTLMDIRRLAGSGGGGTSQMDEITAQLLAQVDVDRYRAQTKARSLRWTTLLGKAPRAIATMTGFGINMARAVFWPERFHRKFTRVIDQTVAGIQGANYEHLTVRELVEKLNADLTPVIGKIAGPPMSAYMYFMMQYMSQVETLVAGGSAEDKKLADALTVGFAGNEAASMGIQLYHMAQMLPPGALDDLDSLAQKIAQGAMPADFMAAWDRFMTSFGARGPSELELSNPRYGDDPKLALEQMSYMVGSASNPEEMQADRVKARQHAYETLLGRLKGRQRRKFQRIYKIIDLFGPARDTPKYLWVLDNAAVRKRALQEGQKFTDAGRFDAREDIFWLTLDEIDRGNAEPTLDLRALIDAKKPFYRKLNQVAQFPRMIDSRGRIAQVKHEPSDDPNVITGAGISNGKAIGRVKVLRKPREKPIEKGDVLVTYTTDPGWTPLFVNAEAVILEVGGMLQHGGVVTREYGKPCVVGIQGITSRLQDGQLVEVDGTNGTVRLLDEAE